MNIIVDLYVKLVWIVDSLYNVYANLIMKADSYRNLDKINLNKKRVDDIFYDYIVDKNFYYYIQFYINCFNIVFFTNHNPLNVDSMIAQIEDICFIKQARYRIKSPESIKNKLNKYINCKENGKIKIKKCLNDLFGIRFIINDYGKFREEFIDYLNMCIDKKKFKSKIKLISKGYENTDSLYVADHIYYSSENNNIFPIELQIWDSENAERNEESHIKYKRDYINWSNQYTDI